MVATIEGVVEEELQGVCEINDLVTLILVFRMNNRYFCIE